MPGVEVNLTAPCERCGCECNSYLATLWLFICGGLAYFIANIAVNSQYTDVEDSCISEIMPYSWASLINILILGAECAYVLTMMDTKGRFDNCNDEYCQSCACCFWILILTPSLLLSIFGSMAYYERLECLPTPLLVLIGFSLGIQYLGTICAIWGFLFRSGILTCKD